MRFSLTVCLGNTQKPELLCQKYVPKRRISAGKKGPITLLHAVTHIEPNAIDLALDMAGRYAAFGLPFDFVRDWLSVANDKSKHIMLFSDRLKRLDISRALYLQITACGKQQWPRAMLWQADWQLLRLC